MVNYIAQGDTIAYNIIEFAVDKRDEISSLPTDIKRAAPGSTCIVIEDASVWMLNSDGVWVEL